MIPRRQSGRWWRLAMSAAIVASVIVSLLSCAAPPPAPPLPVECSQPPAYLLEPTSEPQWSGETWRDVALLVVETRAALARCNADKAAAARTQKTPH